MGLKEWIIPQEEVFFELMAKQSQKVDEASELLLELMDDFSSLRAKRKKIKDLEHEADNIVHDIYYKLNETLITPIDHEDISKLASFYDSVIDHIFGTVNRIELYEIKKPTPAMKRYAELVRGQVRQINKGIALIKEMRKEEMEKSCEEVHRLENEGDELLYSEISKLFKGKDAIEIMKMKEIYENLEIITDLCEDVSNVLLDIRMKYS